MNIFKRFSSTGRILREIETMAKHKRYREIIDTLLALTPQKLNDELKCQLAAAYNKTGEYEKALTILADCSKKMEGSAEWNLQTGYAYLHLHDYSAALSYFDKASEINPGDEVCRFLASQCHIHNPFAQRVDRFWEWFSNHAPQLSEMLENTDGELANVRELLLDGLSILGDDVFFNIGADRELTFCVDAQNECYYLYPYLVSRMPQHLKEQWVVYPCKQPTDTANFIFQMYNKKIEVGKVCVSADFDEESCTFDLQYHHPKLAELNHTESLSAFSLILELTIGEGAAYNYIRSIKRANSPEGMILIGDLSTAMKAAIESKGKNYATEPEINDFAYFIDPDNNKKDSRLRCDIVSGTTRYMDLCEEYVREQSGIYNYFAAKGAEAAMLIVSQPDGISDNDLLELRYRIEDRLADLFDRSIVKGMVLGGAYALSERAYIDLLLYDGPQFIEYLKLEGTLASLLTMKDGAPCPSEVYFKDFVAQSPLLKLQ